ncbi:PAS domain-containing sensor histidine kinase [Corallococcus sp. AB011P]|uniref:sensor histidine kinase n=1 Tax=unclassified Corallococcus TaxID=2685029 RepID=UPI000EA072C1|nr:MULTISPECIES: PAS domain-containing sensor histidine kinase [unclassified Corallococcus]RKG48338.1 PAS domain-containing sensor histidine kinase [Corallococcus sp. AB011P]RKH87870.1 PAS domain-containing sensor histidine kinase [Corallococcus sp. AB045]
MRSPLDDSQPPSSASGGDIAYATPHAARDMGAQLGLFIDSVKDYAILTLDPAGDIMSWNTGAERIKGYRSEEILGQHFSRFYPPEDIARGKPQQDLEIVNREGRFEEEGWRVRKDHSLFWANVVITAMRDAQGQLVGYGQVTRDFTERKLAQEQLLQSEERFRLLVEHIQDYAIYMLDPDGRVTTWNAGAERFKQYKAEEIIGQHFSRFFPPEDVARGKPWYALQVAASEGHFEEEAWRVRKDGSLFWASVVITALHDPAGKLRGFAKVTRDITQRKQNQERRELEMLRDAVRARDEFLSVASHELKTPLTPLQLKLTALLRTVENNPSATLPVERIARDLEVARRQVRKLSDLIEDLLDVSRISMGQLRLDRAPMDLTSLARDVVTRYAPQSAQVGCTVTMEATTPIRGHWDRARMDQVITNLLTNALKYGAGKPIHVRVRMDSGLAVLSVKDEGIGIPLEDQPRVFERFVRAVSERNYGGLGLGLFITQQIIEAHGGIVQVRSILGAGSTFTVMLPPGPDVSPASGVPPEP